MLAPEQRETLAIEICRWLPNNWTVEVVAAYLNRELAERAPNFPYTYQLAVWIVDQALDHETSELFVKVVDQLIIEESRIAWLSQLADELRAGTRVWISSRPGQSVNWKIDGDPDAVGDGRPFLDRVAFRHLLPRCDETIPHSTPVCTVVLGNSGSGKTYLHEYCSHFANRSAELQIGYALASKSGLTRLSPGLVAIQLARGLGTDYSRRPRDHEDLNRHAHNLVSWLTEYTPKRAVPALAIFDGFDHVDLPTPVNALIEQLILTLQNDSEARERMRVVLLQYNVDRLEDKGIHYETCVLEHIGTTEIEQWLRRRYPDQPEYRYTDTAKIIDQELPDHPHRMPLLCHLVEISKAEFER